MVEVVTQELKVAVTRNPREHGGLWFFDKGSGSLVRDQSPKGNDGNISNCSWVDGKYGKCLQYDGSTAYVEVPKDPTLTNNQITVFAWVKMPTLPSDIREVIRKVPLPNAGGTLGGYFIEFRGDLTPERWHGGIFQTDEVSKTAWINYTESTDLDQWILLVLTADGSNVNIYKNTTLGTPDPYDGTIGEGEELLIGAYHARTGTSLSRHWNGLIDECGLIPRAYSQAEIDFMFLEWRKNITQLKTNHVVTDFARSFDMVIPDVDRSKYSLFAYGDDVRIFINAIRHYRGRVVDIKFPESLVKLWGLDYTSRLQDRGITKVYGSEATPREISDCITNASDGIIPFWFPDITTNNVVNTGVDVYIEFVENLGFDAIYEFSRYAEDYDFHVDDDKDLHFKPRTTEDSGLTFKTNNVLWKDFPVFASEFGNSIRVFGDPSNNVSVKVQDGASILQYGEKVLKAISDPLIKTNYMARKRGWAEIRARANPVSTGEILCHIVGRESLKAGELVKCEFPRLGINERYVVLEAVFEIFPEFMLKCRLARYIEGAPDLVALMEKRLRAVELRGAFLDPFEWYITPAEEPQIKFEYDIVVKKETISNARIWNHPTFSKWNQDNRWNGGVTVQVIQTIMGAT